MFALTKKKAEYLTLAFFVTIFTALFVHVPVSLKLNPLDRALRPINLNLMVETANINEILLVKMCMTYLLFTKTDLTCTEFLIYTLILEALLLALTRKSSIILHVFLQNAFFMTMSKLNPTKKGFGRFI